MSENSDDKVVLQIRGGEMRLVAGDNNDNSATEGIRQGYIKRILSAQSQIGVMNPSAEATLQNHALDGLAWIASEMEKMVEFLKSKEQQQMATVQPTPEYRPHFKAGEKDYGSGKGGDEVIKRMRDISRTV